MSASIPSPGSAEPPASGPAPASSSPSSNHNDGNHPHGPELALATFERVARAPRAVSDDVAVAAFVRDCVWYLQDAASLPESATGTTRVLQALDTLYAIPPRVGTAPLALVEAARAHIRAGSARDTGLARHLLVTLIRAVDERKVVVVDVESENGSSRGTETIPSALLWDTLAALLLEGSEHSKVDALAVWLQYLLSQPEHRDGHYESLINSRPYWAALQDSLLTGSDSRRKYALAVVGASAGPAAGCDMPAKQRLSLERWCTAFEALVLGRYLNQAIDAVAQLDNLLKSGLAGDWALVLLAAALGEGVQERHRAAAGCWLLQNGSALAAIYSAHPVRGTDLIVNIFLEWATQGSLFLDSTVREGGELPTSKHGDQLSLFLHQFIAGLSEKEEEVAFVDQILTRLSGSTGAVFPLSIPYILASLLPSLKRHGEKLSSKWAPTLVELCNKHGLSPAARVAMLEIAQLIGIEAEAKAEGGRERAAYDSVEEVEAELRAPGAKAFSRQRLGQYISAILDIGSRQEGALAGTAPSCLSRVVDLLWTQFKIQECPNTCADIIRVLFDPEILQVCRAEEPFQAVISDAIELLPKLSLTRPPFLNLLTQALHTVFFHNRPAFDHFHLDLILTSLLADQPTTTKDALFDQAIAQLPRRICPADSRLPSHAGECEYERLSYTRIFDLVNRIGILGPARTYRMLHSLLQPWWEQTEPVPAAVLKYKKTVHLKAAYMLVQQLLSEHEQQAADDGPVNLQDLIDKFLHCLRLEPLPNRRLLLEWILVRIALAHPALHRDLLAWFREKGDDVRSSLSAACAGTAASADAAARTNPRYLASVVRILTAVYKQGGPATAEPDVFAFVTELLARAMSTKVTIRYDSQWALLVLLGAARDRGWTSLSDNPVLAATVRYLEGLVTSPSPPSPPLPPPSSTSSSASQPLSTPAHVAMMKKTGEFDLFSLFQGAHTTLQPAEPVLVREADFVQLDRLTDPGLLAQAPRSVPLSGRVASDSAGRPATTASEPDRPQPTTTTTTTASKTDAAPDSQSFLQTKGTAWKTLLNIHSDDPAASPSSPPGGPSPSPSNPDPGTALSIPPSSTHRNADLLVVGSLLSSPANLGGLTRAAEIFGAAALYLPGPAILDSPLFQSVSVTAEKHLPIRICPAGPATPATPATPASTKHAHQTTKPERPARPGPAQPADWSGLVALFDRLRVAGYSVVGIEQTEASRVLGADDCLLPKRVVLVLGNEQTGIPAPVLSALDLCVEIRQRGVIRSLNVQTAAAVVLAEYARQHYR